MKTLGIVIILIVSIFSQAQTNDLQVYVFSGTYQGENIFVQNPLDKDGIGFAVKYVTINNEKTTEQFFSSAFEINLKKHDFPMEEQVSIKLFYNSDVAPKIINQEALTTTSKISVSNIWIEKDSLLKWCLADTLAKDLTYVIEQYRWNKWIKLGEVKANADANCYEFYCDLHSGENKFRVVHFYRNGVKITSDVVITQSDIKPVEIESGEYSDSLWFSAATKFEIYSEDGVLLVKGFSDKPKTEHLMSGLYYINLDNKTETWIKN